MTIVSGANAVVLRKNHPVRYVVKPGDTLWGIANKFLLHPWDWKTVWRANKNIPNPNLIYPGDVLVLSLKNGQPIIRRAKRGIKVLTPTAERVPENIAIPTIPYRDITPYLLNAKLMHPKQYLAKPYVLSVYEKQTIGYEPERIYVRGEQGSGLRNYTIFYRSDVIYKHIDYNRDVAVAFFAVPIGRAYLVKGGDPATFVVTESKQEVQSGDRLWPTADLQPMHYIPQAPKLHFHAHVEDAVGFGDIIAPYDIIVFNAGSYQGLVPGDVVAIKRPGDLVADPYAPDKHKWLHHAPIVETPSERIAEALVYRVYDNYAIALTMHAKQEIEKGDIVTNP